MGGMNIINQREVLKRIAGVRLLSAKALGLALQAPVFVWDMPPEGRIYSKEELEFLNTSVLEPGTQCPKLLPFPLFRVATWAGFDLWFHTGTMSLTCLSYTRPGDLGVEDEPKSESLFEHEYRWVLEEGSVQGEGAAPTRIKGRLTAMVDWKPVPEGKVLAMKEKDPKGFEGMFMEPLRNLQGFLFDMEYPGNVVVKVEPAEKPGKSVEWRLARTHYCILRRGDARACQRQATGPSEEQIVRAAHWRRAHFRRLRSAVFTQKRGQLVAVRHAWVGPAEWKGNDGKVYRVVTFERGEAGHAEN